MPIYNNKGDIPKSVRNEEVRNTVITPNGIDRVYTYTDSSGNKRKKVERINKMRGMTALVGAPKPTLVEFDSKTKKINQPVNVLVSFNQPLLATGSFTLNIANTSGGSALVATANNSLSYAENTLKFAFTPTVAGTYQVRGQTLGGTNTLKSVAANTAATKVFANTLSTSVLVVTI